ncbi:MAG: transporter substrate-binding domain-containing protein [Alphaproteobacteria bacterium]|nr:transporter substrate-binding domain-containing protein [Alphaproteobacteria bacterium]
MDGKKRDFLKVVGAAGLGASAAGLASCGRENTAIERDADPIERVLRTNKLRAGYILYDVMVKRDPATGRLGGLVHDVAQKAAKNIGVEIEWSEEVYFGNAFEGLNTGRYDVVFANLWPTGPRIRAAGFCQPMFYSGLGIYARPGNAARFKTVRDINDPGVTISTIDGDISAYVIEDRFSSAKVTSMPLNTDYAQMLLNVGMGKADIVLADIGFANSYIKQNPGSLTELFPGHPLQVFANCFAMNHDHAKLKSVVDQSVAELLNRGTVDEYIERYEKLPGDYLRVAKSYREQRAS